MALVRSRVSVTNNFPAITDRVNDLAKRAATAGAREGAAVAAARASERSKSGRMSAIRVTPVRGSTDGWEASFVSPAYYSWFQNTGTLGSRSKPLKSAPRTNRTRAPGTGIEPLRFLEAGRAAGTAAMRRVIAGGL